ncbi:MAG: hypothetical protein BroJett011_38350 [Chloroflexota bacterium]|nr:MAG: hypothetical protein BroJett011_38350 [Chloroflexota bacterium]
MASKNLPVAKAEDRLPTGDDFKVITGVGPGIEHRLHQAGIQTFAQLAALAPTEIAALVSDLAGMSAERIAKQDWTGQARKLIPESAEIGPQSGETLPRAHQHYATFTIELLLDEDNNVRRTRIAHIQDKDEDTWAGWAGTRIVGFITRRAALRLSESEPVSVSAVIAEPPSVATRVAEPSPTLATSASPVSSSLRLHQLETVPVDVTGPCSILHYGQPFNMHLTLDLTGVAMLSDGSLTYSAAIYAKNLNDGSTHIVGETQGAITSEEKLTINMAGIPLGRGAYRLEAVATLISPSVKPGPMAYLEGSLLQVY